MTEEPSPYLQNSYGLDITQIREDLKKKVTEKQKQELKEWLANKSDDI